MKKVFESLLLTGLLTFGLSSSVLAQDAPTGEDVASTEEVMDTAATSEVEEEIAAPVKEEVAETPAEATEEGVDGVAQKGSWITVLKEQFVAGGPAFMGIVLLCLIIGLALCIERIIYLNLSTINTKKFMNDLEGALTSGGVEKGKELCRNTRGPIASICYQGLDRSEEGVELVEKAVVSYGGVQMGLMEKGVSWISLFIALAPMLGFMGTVIGMIQAFATIVENGAVETVDVAKGIQVALLTTVFGLIVAIILQVFYNYIVSKIDGLVNEMEDASITLVDIMLKNKITSLK
jgi:biopolymer transport protein ExbB